MVFQRIVKRLASRLGPARISADIASLKRRWPITLCDRADEAPTMAGARRAPNTSGRQRELNVPMRHAYQPIRC